jgi:ankyrin repeat protein
VSWGKWEQGRSKAADEKGSDVDVDSKDSNIRTPLQFVEQHEREAVVKLLLERATDVNSKGTEHGRTWLSWTAENGDEEVVMLTLKKRNDVDLDSRESNDRTPLPFVAKYRHEEVVEMLLKEADVGSKDAVAG